MSIKSTATDQETTAYERRIALLTEAVEEYQSYLVRYAHSFTHNWQDAENIIQELWKYVIVYYEDKNLKSLTMLRRKAYQLFIDQYRGKQRKPLEFSDDLPEAETAWKEQQTASSIEEKELKADFYGQFTDLDLTDIQKDVFWLHARYDYTLAEISEQTGKATSTLSDWIALARRKIAAQLSEGDQ